MSPDPWQGELLADPWVLQSCFQAPHSALRRAGSKSASFIQCYARAQPELQLAEGLVLSHR